MPLTPLLFLSPRIPWPLNTGAKIRTGALLGALRAHFAVDYAGFLQPDLSEAEARSALAGCRAISFYPERPTGALGKAWLGARTLPDRRPATIAKYWRAALAERVREWTARHPRGIVHADHLHLAPYLQQGTAALRVMDEHNVESRIIERLAEQCRRWPLHPYLALQARRMKACEAELARRADLVLAVSDGDAVDLRALAPAARVEVIPNGVDLEYFTPSPAARPARPGRLVFTGSMNWLPNQDAMVYCVREIMPRLPAGRDWSLDIVGQSPPPPVTALASEKIRVTGTVEDVRPYIREASIYIVPLRIGGGSRLKILEAFAMGVPLVSTSVGCEGLGVEDGQQLLIADTPADFARATARLADDPALGERLTRCALNYVREHFGWPSIGQRLIELYDEILDTSVPTTKGTEYTETRATREDPFSSQ